MVEVMNERAIEKVSQPQVQAYLQKRFKELVHPLHPSREGYFIYVEDFAVLQYSHSLSFVTLPSIAEGLFRYIEGISIKENIVEVSILFNNEFLLSLIFYDLDTQSLTQIASKPQHHLQALVPAYNTHSTSSTCSAGLSNLAVSAGMVLLRCMIKR